MFPLITYALYHPKEFNQRLDSLNVFAQNLPTEEVTKELQGASFRTLTMFFLTGDPNPRQNPAGTPPFDPITSTLFFAGSICLFIKNREIFGVTAGLTIIILASEIITLERIPEFHYYGLGHPNTLRISLLIPIVIFTVLWASRLVKEKHKTVIIVIFVLLISAINLNRYFNQKPNPWIYTTNFVVPLKIIDALNRQKPDTVAFSDSLYNVQHWKYFLDPSISVTKISASQICHFQDQNQKLAFLLAQDLSGCRQEEIQRFFLNPATTASVMTSPWGTVDGIVLAPR